jgi:alpha-L-fucosidase 2
MKLTSLIWKRFAVVSAGLFMLAAFILSYAQANRTTNSIPAYQGEFTGQVEPPAEPLTLWYRRPARQWVEALPIGNGRLGAMIFGGIVNERLQLNEDTLYGGGPYDPNNPTLWQRCPMSAD